MAVKSYVTCSELPSNSHFFLFLLASYLLSGYYWFHCCFGFFYYFRSFPQAEDLQLEPHLSSITFVIYHHFLLTFNHKLPLSQFEGICVYECNIAWGCRETFRLTLCCTNSSTFWSTRPSTLLYFVLTLYIFTYLHILFLLVGNLQQCLKDLLFNLSSR